MIFLLRLAARNLLRQVRRTILSLSAIVAGVAVLILGQGFIGGLNENIVRAQVDSLSGHVLVRPAAYPEVGLQHPIEDLVAVSPELAAWLQENSQAWTTRLLFVPRLISGPDAIRVRAIGFDPARDEAVFERGSWNLRGEMPNGAADGVAVSKGVARLLELSPGDRLVLQARTRDGAMNALDVPVAAVYSTGNPALDTLGVFVPMQLAADLVRPGGGVSHVALRLDRRDRSEVVAAALRDRLGEGAEVATWQDETRDMLAIQEIRRRALELLVLALMGMSATGIANTILMAAYERVREIGTLRAMGMTRGGVVRLFVAEGALMGVVGAMLGAAIGAGVVGWYAERGIDLSAAIEQSAGGNIPVSSMLYLDFSIGMVAAAFVFGLLVAVLASIWPAWVASKQAPADAVRAA